MEEQKSSNSKSPKGHGTGKQIMPGANLAPAGSGRGNIGTVVAPNPLTLKIKSGKSGK